MPHEEHVSLIPREVLFGNPEMTSPRLSPDGTLLSYLAPKDGVLNVWVGPAGSKPGGEDFRPVTDDEKRGIRVYFWAEDGEHLLYLQDEDGDENWRMYAVRPKAGEVAARSLTPFENVQVRPLEKSRRHPEKILIELNRRNPELHDACALDLKSGELELLAENPGNVAGWLADADLRVRGAATVYPDGSLGLLFREDEHAEWREILRWSAEDGLSSGPVGFSGDGRRIFLRDSRGADAARLVELDTETDEIQVLAEDPRYDVSEVLVHPETREVQAVAFARARTEWEVIDEEIREDFEAIRSLHPGDFSVVSRDREDRRWIVAFTADDGPGSFYSYDRKSREGTLLFHDRPALADYTLAKMEPISFTSRDGLRIEGYLTLPPGARKPLPMVLDVHGGPWARDEWGYDPEAQWLANRGYACLQVNYRGSTGYGKRFLNAGNKEWGGRMHDDLVDAVRWAVEEGIADPERVAIYGGSYGGYAALVGAAFTPDLFRCAVDIVGPSNLITLINTIPPYWKPLISTFTERVGNPKTEEEFLKSRSPLFRAQDIKIPLLIAQGANDPRVKRAESEQIVSALKENGVEHEYLLFEDEGHGFARPENRLKFYAAAERFLARHLGGRYEE
ncbi:S9 family peptidase [Rubrobacter calidifluminis]|uniref:S9 family peptidase n=1 Tax=Rubrobacter calidifluminis TaxID=1392640 RepID=UPI002362AABC|nr:S9 family peptidase [Rubrobacter calidifluminis]